MDEPANDGAFELAYGSGVLLANQPEGDEDNGSYRVLDLEAGADSGPQQFGDDVNQHVIYGPSVARAGATFTTDDSEGDGRDLWFVTPDGGLAWRQELDASFDKDETATAVTDDIVLVSNGSLLLAFSVADGSEASIPEVIDGDEVLAPGELAHPEHLYLVPRGTQSTTADEITITTDEDRVRLDAPSGDPLGVALDGALIAESGLETLGPDGARTSFEDEGLDDLADVTFCGSRWFGVSDDGVVSSGRLDSDATDPQQRVGSGGEADYTLFGDERHLVVAGCDAATEETDGSCDITTFPLR